MDTLTRDELTFKILRSKLPRAQELAAKLGLELEVGDIDEIRLAASIYEQQNDCCAPSYDRLPAGIQRWAHDLAEAHCIITAHAPRSEWSVVAIADRSEGAPMFHAIDPTIPYWTSERMDAVNFGRCDECGVQSRRNKVFIVARDTMAAEGQPHGSDVVEVEDGKRWVYTRQIGGTCAKHLNLAKKVRDLLDGFQSFLSGLSNDEDEDGWGSFGSSGVPTYCLPLVLLFAEETIGFEGYVSRKSSEVTGRMTTAQQVRAAVCDAKGKLAKELRATEQWKRALARSEAGEGEALAAEIVSWLDAQSDDSFHRNIRTAFTSQAERYIGLVVFAVAEIRNWRLEIEARKRKAEPKCYVHVETSLDDVLAACELSAAELGELLGHELTGKVKAPARKALAKVLPGVWTLIARASWDSQFGWQDMLQLERADGSRVKWITGSLDSDTSWQKGDRYLVLAASLGEDMGAHEKYGVQGRKISRAWIVPVPVKNVEVSDAA